jgi:hypothetical protein
MSPAAGNFFWQMDKKFSMEKYAKSIGGNAQSGKN